jgi:asparagine synthase (glutamine-hydrolysing)
MPGPFLHPPQDEFFQETVRKLQALYQFDCLRANKATMAWGVEARVPFLDRSFLDVAMAIDPAEKMIDKSKGEGAAGFAWHLNEGWA